MVKYSNEQIAAIRSITLPSKEADASKIAVLTGGPGTGKSTVSYEVVRRWERLYGSRCVVALSPTGKAARRFEEVTGWPAYTIHRALIKWERTEGDFDDSYLEEVKEADPSERGLPDLWDVRALLIDESSMVDIYLARRLMEVLPERTRILFVGDADQLPSVGPGAVFRDLIRSQIVPTTRLTQIYRQNVHSWISKNAARVLQGEMPVIDPDSIDYFHLPCEDHDAVTKAVRTLVMAHPAAQLMAPTKKNAIGTEALNTVVRDTVNPRNGRTYWRAGRMEFLVDDRVIHKKNNYKLGVMNGEIGLVLDAGEYLVVDYGDRIVEYDKQTAADQLRLAFALTIHSSQGSEYEEAIIIVHSSHSFLLSRALVYTALTRAKKKVWIVGDEKGMKRAIGRRFNYERKTFLVERLREGIDIP